MICMKHISDSRKLFKILPDSIRYRIWQDFVRLLVQLLINESP